MLLTVVVATTFLAALAPFVGKILGRRAGWPLAGGLLALGVLLWASEPFVEPLFTVPWMPSLGVEFALRLDGLSLLFSLLVLIIGAVVLAYSARYLGSGAQGGFYGLMTLFALAMLVLVLADDVIVLFVAWETTTLCSFFLIARSGPKAREPAIRTLLVTAGGGLILLAAVVVMSLQVGSTRLSVILADPVWGDNTWFTATTATLLAVAAFTKSAQFPFHAWLPDAMAAATPVSAYLHAAAMVKAGIYLLMRCSEALGGVAAWNTLLITFGLATAVLGAVLALRRSDLKELLAYSTVSQLGFLVAVIGVGTTTALIAAAVHTLAHALFKSALFMFVGVIEHQAGSRRVNELSGLRHTMPGTAAAVSLAALSMAGVPVLLGFISKESVFTALLDAPGPAWTGPTAALVAVGAAVLTFAYSGKIVLDVFGGPPQQRPSAEAALPYLIPASLPAYAGLLLGVWPALADRLISGTASSALGVDVDAHLALWHGLNLALLLSAVVITLGSALVAFRHRTADVFNRGSLPFSALGVVDTARDGLIRIGAKVGDLTRSDSPTRHLAIPVTSLVVIAAVGVATIGALPSEVGEVTRSADWVLVVLLAVGVLGAVVVHTRLAAIAVVGVVGFSVTLWFFQLGAADVALTQLLVEILTVVVMVMLLRRLPARFRKESRRRAVGAGTVAVGAGVATTLAVLALTGRRELSDAGDYFLREAEDATGGTNVVNTILVDFRALDTLGELTVLGIAGIAVVALLQARPLLPKRNVSFQVTPHSPLRDAHDNAVFGRSLSRMLGPVIVVMSLFFLLRGHNDPGGGFIAALIGGAFFAAAYLTASADSTAKVRAPFIALIGSGVMVAVATGFLGYFDGSFLLPLHADLFGVHLTTALIFDVGVYLAVIGVVLAALNLLGRSPPPGLVEPAPKTAASTSRNSDDLEWSA